MKKYSKSNCKNKKKIVNMLSLKKIPRLKNKKKNWKNLMTQNSSNIKIFKRKKSLRRSLKKKKKEEVKKLQTKKERKFKQQKN